MMSLDELEAMKESKTPLQRPEWTLRDELEHVNWRLVIAIAFGFLMWYAGSAMLEQFVKTCPQNSPTCNEP